MVSTSLSRLQLRVLPGLTSMPLVSTNCRFLRCEAHFSSRGRRQASTQGSSQPPRHIQATKAGDLGFDPALLHYLVDNSVRDHPEAAALREVTALHPRAVMQISPDEGQLLQMILKLLGARRTIEVGVFTGYSALVSALALPTDGKLVACDVSEEFVSVGRSRRALKCSD